MVPYFHQMKITLKKQQKYTTIINYSPHEYIENKATILSNLIFFVYQQFFLFCLRV